MNLRRASATAVRRFPGRKLSPSVAAAGRRDGHAEGHVAEEEEDDVGPEVRVEDVSAAEGRVGRAGGGERGEADDGGRRHRLGSTREIQRRFNVSVSRARVPNKASTLRDRSER